MACWCRCPLSSLSSCVQVLSSTVVSQQACEKARSQAGEDPRNWLPVFYGLLNEKK